MMKEGRSKLITQVFDLVDQPRVPKQSGCWEARETLLRNVREMVVTEKPRPWYRWIPLVVICLS